MLSVATSKASLQEFVGLFLVRAFWIRLPLSTRPFEASILRYA